MSVFTLNIVLSIILRHAPNATVHVTKYNQISVRYNKLDEHAILNDLTEGEASFLNNAGVDLLDGYAQIQEITP